MQSGLVASIDAQFDRVKEPLRDMLKSTDNLLRRRPQSAEAGPAAAGPKRNGFIKLNMRALHCQPREGTATPAAAVSSSHGGAQPRAGRQRVLKYGEPHVSIESETNVSFHVRVCVAFTNVDSSSLSPKSSNQSSQTTRPGGSKTQIAHMSTHQSRPVPLYPPKTETQVTPSIYHTFRCPPRSSGSRRGGQAGVGAKDQVLPRGWEGQEPGAWTRPFGTSGGGEILLFKVPMGQELHSTFIELTRCVCVCVCVCVCDEVLMCVCVRVRAIKRTFGHG